MTDEAFLVTGAMGCIGAWVLRHLTDDGVRVVAADLGTDRARPRLVMSDEALDAPTWLVLDVTDGAAVRRAVADYGITHIVHLAGLQIPFCAANPPHGAAVNVAGTVNILEAARHEAVTGLAYASSLAVLGPPDRYDDWPLPDDSPRFPATLYGVFKVANEETARVYAQDWGVGSAGIRPSIVYGVGRDQGVSSDIAKAVLAAAAARPFRVRFGGPVSLQHGSDIARIFIAAARAAPTDAILCNVRNDVIDVADVVALIKDIEPSADLSVDSKTQLPVPADLDDAALRRLIGSVPHTPLTEAMRADIAQYRNLISRGLIDLDQLDQ